MPTYEYYCAPCKSLVEVIRSILDNQPEICPLCKKEMTKQISGNNHVVYKGDGWARRKS